MPNASWPLAVVSWNRQRDLQRAAEQEGADLVLAAVPLGQRRHRVARVVGERRDDRVDVDSVPGVGPARDDVIDGRVTEVAQHRLLGRRDLGDAAESIALRALCSALLTEAVDVSSCWATSAAEKPSTSRRISAAR